jgi:hypothetical protein
MDDGAASRRDCSPAAEPRAACRCALGVRRRRQVVPAAPGSAADGRAVLAAPVVKFLAGWGGAGVVARRHQTTCGRFRPVSRQLWAIARNWTAESVFAEGPTAEDLAASAVRWLLRGGTWEAFANELAWEAVRSSGVESCCLAWLSDLIEARLAAQIDGLESVLEPARASARAEHLSEWPHDHGGADAAANLAADERAKEEVSRIYLNTLQWAVDLIDDRLGRRPRSLRPLQALRRVRPRAELEVPALVAEGLTRHHPRYGWPTRTNQSATERPEAA